MNSDILVQSRSNRPTSVCVLMADPDVSLSAAYRESLLHEGFELITAVSALDCVTRLRERIPDLLVLEPQLPWGGGDGVLAMMGEVPQLAHVPVMVLTACGDPGLLEAVARFPVSDYQLKPLSSGRLAERLRTILAHPKPRFTLAEQNGNLECLIARRTGGRIRDLRVETVDGQVIVHGRSDSHYVKQLALAAVLKAFEASEGQSERVEVDIEVAPMDGWQAQRRALSETQDGNYPNELVLTKED